MSESEGSSRERPQKIRPLQEIYEFNENPNLFCLFADTDHINFKEASKSDKWRKFMNKEIGIIEKNKTWDVL